MTDDYEVGYKKPPQEHQFKPGQTGNPGGMTKEQRRIISENADKALRIQAMLLDGVMAKLETLEPEQREGILRADVNKIVADAIDRELGKPVARQDHTSSDGSMSPKGLGDFYSAQDGYEGDAGDEGSVE